MTRRLMHTACQEATARATTDRKRLSYRQILARNAPRTASRGTAIANGVARLLPMRRFDRRKLPPAPRDLRGVACRLNDLPSALLQQILGRSRCDFASRVDRTRGAGTQDFESVEIGDEPVEQ